VFLTVGSRRARMRRKSAVGGGRAAETVGDRGETAVGVPRTSGLRGPIRGVPVEVARGLGRPEVHRWRGTKMRRHLPTVANNGGAFQSEQWRSVQGSGRAQEGRCNLGGPERRRG
jgi:hypothetical protein